VVAAPPRVPEVAERAAHEVYADECLAARDHIRHGRAGQSAEAARRALAALPRGVDAQRLLGLALLELGEARPALHAFSAALTADPLDVVSHAGIAEAQELLEGAGSAEVVWLRAWEVEPYAVSDGTNGMPGIGQRLQDARRAAGALDVREGPPPLTRAALARIHLRGRLFEHAAIEARAVLAKEPDRMDVRLTLAEALWRSGESLLAAAVAQEIRERLPDCVAANLLVATHWLAEGRDAGELMARVHAVDPAGSIAQNLFDDREVPVLFGTDALPERHGEPSAEPPRDDRALAETRALSIVEPPPRAAMTGELLPEVPAVAPIPADIVHDSAQAEELEQLIAPELALVTEPESARAADPDAVLKQPAEPVAQAPRLELDTEPELVVVPPTAESTPSRDADDRTNGNTAMQAGRYLDAARAYGAWLRAARDGRTSG